MFALVFFFFILALPFLLLPGAAHCRTYIINQERIYMKKAGQLMLLEQHRAHADIICSYTQQTFP